MSRHKPSKPIAAGREVYRCDHTPAKACGVTLQDSEIDDAIKHRIPSLLGDDAGRDRLASLLSGLGSTQFEQKRLNQILAVPAVVEDWRVGEALAEAFLVDHQQCFFPWPGTRDLKNSKASPAGADLVGFVHQQTAVRFAFGEVKTSSEERWPPQVMTSRHGLAKQLEQLLLDGEEKRQLVRYLGHHAVGSTWQSDFKEATAAYLRCPADVALFGMLVRDVVPKEADLKSRTIQLAKSLRPKALFFCADFRRR